MTNTPIRSVLLETRSYRDTYGETNTSALLCVNGRLVAAFPLHYGSPAITEEYHAAPYLEAVGVLSEGDRHRALGNRLRALGVDYYLTEAVMRRRDCFKHALQVTAEDFWAELDYFAHPAGPNPLIYAEISHTPAKDPKNEAAKK